MVRCFHVYYLVNSPNDVSICVYHNIMLPCIFYCLEIYFVIITSTYMLYIASADHITGAKYLKEKYPSAKTGIGSNVTKVQKEFSKVFNYTEDDLSTDGSQFDVLFKDGDTLKLGEIEGRVIYTPGHTPACVCYVLGNAVFTGDVSIHIKVYCKSC